MAGYLHTELIVEILSRLPSKALLRCRSVCKSWQSLISSSEFILTHAHNFNQPSPRMLVRRFDRRENKELYSVHFDDEDFSVDHGIPIEFPFNRIDFFLFYKIIGSCNGVLCLSNNKSGYRKDRIILWNPSIRRNITLIPPLCQDFFPVFGFGYDRMSDDYKVVRLAYDDNPFIKPQVVVYSVKAAIWRSVEFPPNLLSNIIFPIWSQVFFNGSVHWISYDLTHGLRHCSIMTFGMSNELFGEIQLPEDLVTELATDMEVSVVGQCLAVICFRRLRMSPWGASAYKIWAMKECKNPASWTIVYNIYYPISDMGRALLLRKNGDIIMESIDGDLVFYKNETCHAHYVYASSRGGIVEDSVFVDIYQESLALLDVGHDVQSEEWRVDNGQDEGNDDEWFERYRGEGSLIPLLEE